MLPNYHYLLVLYLVQSFITTYPLDSYSNKILKECRIKTESTSRSTANKGNLIYQTHFLNDFKQN